MTASMAATCVLSVIIVILLISGLRKMVRNILSPTSLYKSRYDPKLGHVTLTALPGVSNHNTIESIK